MPTKLGGAEYVRVHDLCSCVIPWVVMHWSMEVIFEEVRIHLGLETQ